MFTMPTLADFRARFPEFGAVADPAIQIALDMAAIWIDPAQWNNQGDFTLAVLFWTAHYVALSQMEQWAGGLGGGLATSAGTTEADLFVRSIRMQDRSVVYAQRQLGGGAGSVTGGGPGEDLLGLTIYGQLYLQLRTRNIIPVAIV